MNNSKEIKKIDKYFEKVSEMASKLLIKKAKRNNWTDQRFQGEVLSQVAGLRFGITKVFDEDLHPEELDPDELRKYPRKQNKK